ncbi:hypothetical protein BAN20980_04994 [Burkholderia anthina]|uniref:Uncharacterized protein n=1 Tax=Burkholderia anthina TaxID=179879 RepID=A0A6P2GH69_9BURK|nr:hypothetical protein BAN20980_04994 [Burkholderia anthina]
MCGIVWSRWKVRRCADAVALSIMATPHFCARLPWRNMRAALVWGGVSWPGRSPRAVCCKFGPWCSSQRRRRTISPVLVSCASRAMTYRRWCGRRANSREYVRGRPFRCCGFCSLRGRRRQIGATLQMAGMTMNRGRRRGTLPRRAHPGVGRLPPEPVARQPGVRALTAEVIRRARDVDRGGRRRACRLPADVRYEAWPRPRIAHMQYIPRRDNDVAGRSCMWACRMTGLYDGQGDQQRYRNAVHFSSLIQVDRINPRSNRSSD